MLVEDTFVHLSDLTHVPPQCFPHPPFWIAYVDFKFELLFRKIELFVELKLREKA